MSTTFKKNQKVTVERRDGTVSEATFIAAGQPGTRGAFHTVKLPDGKEIKARPSQIKLAA